MLCANRYGMDRYGMGRSGKNRSGTDRLGEDRLGEDRSRPVPTGGKIYLNSTSMGFHQYILKCCDNFYRFG